MKTAKTLTRIAVASFAACTIGSAAQADFTNYTFTYVGSSASAYGTLVIDNTGVATSGTCTVIGSANMDGTYSLLAGSGFSPSNQFIYDNLVNVNGSPSGSPNYFPGDGLLFTSGSLEINIFGLYNGNNYNLWGWNNGYDPTDSGGTFDLVKVPGPGALACLGMAGVFGTRRRRA